MERQLTEDRASALEDAKHSFQSRAGELSELIQRASVQRIQNEIETLRQDRLSPFLFENLNQSVDRLIEDKETELERRVTHLNSMRAALEKERERILDRVIPNRFLLGTDVAVFPVTMEVRFPVPVR